MSLILLLLQKNKIEIRDIRISEILDQYNAYLAQMQKMDLDVASEFVQMAAYLLLIKTKMMVSGDTDRSELDELIHSLEKLQAKDTYEALKKVIPELQKMYAEGIRYQCRGPQLPFESEPKEYSSKPEELLSALMAIAVRGGLDVEPEYAEPAVPQRILYSVKEKSRQLFSLLRNGPVGLKRLYEMCGSRSEVIATFISVLELCSAGSISVVGSDDDYEISLIGGDINEIVDRIVE